MQETAGYSLRAMPGARIVAPASEWNRIDQESSVYLNIDFSISGGSGGKVISEYFQMNEVSMNAEDKISTLPFLCDRYMNKFGDLGRLWGLLNEGYGRLIELYCALILQKLKFHARYFFGCFSFQM